MTSGHELSLSGLELHEEAITFCITIFCNLVIWWQRPRFGLKSFGSLAPDAEDSDGGKGLHGLKHLPLLEALRVAARRPGLGTTGR